LWHVTAGLGELKRFPGIPVTSWTIVLFLFLISLKLQADLLCEASTSDGHCDAWAVRAEFTVSRLSTSFSF
jgi:hypothetical protein